MARNFGRVNVSVTASTGGLTAGLSRAGRQLRGFGAQAQGIGGSITGAMASFVGLGRGATMASVGVRALGTTIKTLLGPLVIITSLAALFAKIGSSARNLDEASKTATRLGMSMTTFQNMSLMAEEAGISVQQMSTLLTVMTRNLGNLANGSKTAQKAFANIGLRLSDLQSLKPEEQFDLISKRIMQLPTAAERTAAAIAIFGRSGAMAMGLIVAAANGTRAELATLQAQLGVTFSDQQLERGLPRGIEMMNDSLSRLSLVLQGFINQLIGELASSITTVSNLIVQFFAQNTQGWKSSTALAKAFASVLRFMAGETTRIYGVFQLATSVIAAFGSAAIATFSGVTVAIENLLDTMATAAEALPGFDVGLASSLRSAQRSVSSLTSSIGDEGEIWGQAAADTFTSSIQNMSNPYAAFDREIARVEEQMRQAGGAAGGAAGENIAKAVRASSESLKAMVVGTSAGEEFANSIMRGFDPRLEGDKTGQRTADAAERTADGVEELADELAGVGGLGLATIAV